ncbi:MAG: hypothetical protein IJX51_05195 [Clostridia bacterium]|nr:hypothetical protein [Clostridia bacterium]
MEFPINLYCKTTPESIKTLDLCRGEEDFRKVYIVTSNKSKFVIKHCSNCFTDHNKIISWYNLANKYNAIGIYCPKPILNLNGNMIYHYLENNRDYYVYAEEFAKYKTAEQFDKKNSTDFNGIPLYIPDLMRSIGKVGNAHFDFLNFSSHFCLFEQHSPPYNLDDETSQAAYKFTEYVKTNLPQYRIRLEKIINLFNIVKEKLRKVYSQLPVSCFQGDLNETNILVDENYNFSGIIDFNVCGREPVLNYAVREALMHIENKILFDNEGNELYFYDKNLEKIRVDSFMKNIKYIQEYYEFNELEKNTFPLLLKYISSFWWEQVYAIKQMKGDTEKVNMIFDWIELQLTRNDIILH